MVRLFDIFIKYSNYIFDINYLHFFFHKAASKGKKEQERYLTMIEKLQEEKRKQQEHVEKVIARLKQVFILML